MITHFLKKNLKEAISYIFLGLKIEKFMKRQALFVK
jgi:hypothetical protein